MKTVTYKRQAIRGMRKMPKAAATRFKAAFKELAEGKGETLDVRKLTNRPGMRLRIGNFRAIFTESATEITILDAGPRGGIY